LTTDAQTQRVKKENRKRTSGSLTKICVSYKRVQKKGEQIHYITTCTTLSRRTHMAIRALVQLNLGPTLPRRKIYFGDPYVVIESRHKKQQEHVSEIMQVSKLLCSNTQSVIMNLINKYK